MNITKSTVLDWDGLQAMAESLASELDKPTPGDDGRIRFTIEPNRYLDVVEVPVDDEFRSYRNTRLPNTACLLLAKADCSELMFTKREMTAAGDYKTKTYTISKNRLQKSDIDLLKRIKYGDESSFDALFDTQDVVKRFYREYKDWLRRLSASINGIDSAADREHYAQILMSRMMFLYFIQTKNFLSDERDYLTMQWMKMRNKGNFYRDFLLMLFFNVLNIRVDDRQTSDFSSIPFLNGGLFKEHDIEITYNNIRIENDIFRQILKFLDSWIWYVDESADYEGGAQSVNPEILGHIFEKTITHQKKKGAYYTPIDVTEFICNGTVVPYCIQRVNSMFSSKYKKIPDVWKNAIHSEYLYFEILKKIKILDPSCGSGEFILTASKILFDLYKNTWQVVKKQKSHLVMQEQELMAGRPDYYFKRRIVTENLYGVDIENGALEICKLRLWLSLVSAMSKDTADPLPNIDYNIMQGNSLVGYINIPDTQQHSIDNPYCLEDILRKIDRLKREYNAETNPRKAMQLSQEIEQEVKPCNDLLNRARVSDLANGETHRPTLKHMNKINPFHWRLHFHEAVLAGGFDIIVGNPPYGAETDYPTTFLKTHKTGNTYAYFMEISMSLLKPSGRIGYIVQVPAISIPKMVPLQKILLDGCSELKISSYDDRPGKLFDGLEHCRASIILGTTKAFGNESTCAIFTTGYNRWNSKDRSRLFDRMQDVGYTRLDFESNVSQTDNTIQSFAVTIGTIPKLQNEMEKSILTKILLKSPLNEYIRTKSDFAVYYHDSPQYWIRAMDVPALNSTVSVSTHVRRIHLKNRKAATVALALLNSSLFYWFFIKTSGCRDLTAREINNIRIDIDAFATVDISKLKTLTRKLMINYKKHCIITTDKRRGGTTEYEKVYPRYGKPIIDKIDDILAKHYGLTHDEATYIKQFDEKFRIKSD